MLGEAQVNDHSGISVIRCSHYLTPRVVILELWRKSRFSRRRRPLAAEETSDANPILAVFIN